MDSGKENGNYYLGLCTSMYAQKSSCVLNRPLGLDVSRAVVT